MSNFWASTVETLKKLKTIREGAKVETRIEKYKELRKSLEADNVRIENDMNSNNLFKRMRARYIANMKCKGKRAK